MHHYITVSLFSFFFFFSLILECRRLYSLFSDISSVIVMFFLFICLIFSRMIATAFSFYLSEMFESRFSIDVSVCVCITMTLSLCCTAYYFDMVEHSMAWHGNTKWAKEEHQITAMKINGITKKKQQEQQQQRRKKTV